MTRYAATDAATGLVTGWFDTAILTYPDLDLGALTEVPDDVWEQRFGLQVVLRDGVLVPFEAPAPVATLASRLAELAAERYRRQTAGVSFQASTADAPARAASDPVSTGLLTASYVAARDGHWTDGTPWKMADGSFVSLTAADMQGLALTVLAHVSACYAHEGQLAAALASDLTTDIGQGWPDAEGAPA